MLRLVADPTYPADQRARSFDAWAHEYDRFRPGYPGELFEHIARRLHLPTSPSVADLGAGTGKAALAMARRGWSVIAVEPGGPMLEVLRARAEGEGLMVDTREARAEATGLADASVDLVTAAQAYHWFEKPTVVEEMARIVRPGGGVAVFWNVRDDDRSSFLAAYTDLLATRVPESRIERNVPRSRSKAKEELGAGGWFEVDERVEVRHDMAMGAGDFLGLAFTASYVRALDGPEQEQFRAELSELVAAHATGGRLVVPYQVDLYVGERVVR
jgi:SAM-dependent methyltransferase